MDYDVGVIYIIKTPISNLNQPTGVWFCKINTINLFVQTNTANFEKLLQKNF